MRAEIEDVPPLIDGNEGRGQTSDSKGRTKGKNEIKGRFRISKVDWYTVNPDLEEDKRGIS